MMVARPDGLLTVVVIDDDPDVRSVMRMAFEADGRFLVLAEADSALEGVRLASSWRPDAILLDVRMPEVDGLSILPDIRRQAPDAKVLVFSVLDEELMRPQLEAAGADDYRAKGTSPNEIVHRLAALCGEPAR